MGHDDIIRWRQQMGQGIAAWADHPGMAHEVSSSSWHLLTGAPSADVNLAVVYDDDPKVLSAMVAKIERMGCPALLMLAGDGRTELTS